jgi:hypothetical protein
VEQIGVSISALLTHSFYLLSLNYRKNKETKETAAFAENGRKIGAEEEDEDQTGGSSPTVTAHLCWRNGSEILTEKYLRIRLSGEIYARFELWIQLFIRDHHQKKKKSLPNLAGIRLEIAVITVEDRKGRAGDRVGGVLGRK